MSEIQNNEPKIVSVQMLKKFKEQFLTDLGITSANKSLIQTGNNVSNIAKSMIIGEGHSNLTENTLQNIIVAGFRNIVSTNNQAIFGLYNEPTDSLFVVGGGTNSSNRHNAFEVTKDGIVKGNANVTTANAHTFDDTTLVPLGYIKELSLPDNTMVETAVNNAITEKLSTIDFSSAFENSINNKLNKMSESVSYLFSKLTVAELDNEGQPIKFFAVGFADDALDYDTEIDIPQEAIGGTD